MSPKLSLFGWNIGKRQLSSESQPVYPVLSITDITSGAFAGSIFRPILRTNAAPEFAHNRRSSPCVSTGLLRCCICSEDGPEYRSCESAKTQPIWLEYWKAATDIQAHPPNKCSTGVCPQSTIQPMCIHWINVLWRMLPNSLQGESSQTQRLHSTLIQWIHMGWIVDCGQ
jgi:hypothetical protein